MRRKILPSLLLITTIIMLVFGLMINTNSIIAESDSDNNDSINTSINNKKCVYLGGIPLGINVKSRGLVICSKQEVITEKGVKVPFQNVTLHEGDMLISIDGMRVYGENDVRRAISGKKQVEVEIESQGKTTKYNINTAIDVLTSSEKLGLWLKDGITGIGTLTYVDGSSNRYGALGHPIEKDKSYRCGNILGANITGFIPGEKGKAGELNGDIIAKERLGTIEKNTDYGIFGEYYGKTSNLKKIQIATRDEVKPGKAYIYTTINGNKPKKYEIEIIKKNSQSKPNIKGMVIRILDKELLDKTNGILQGMSGSPIIQNDKLIGAVTHVFINDPTKGFGVYIDFMLGN